ncbi:baseplate wedge subunit [Klebsiella phage CPRSA]|nr:baseplate wedge subunit [Klebsiella phage CPRSA]
MVTRSGYFVIHSYYTDNVEIFNKSFSVSKMLTYVDQSDTSIIGSEADIKLLREIDNYYSAPMSGIHFLNRWNRNQSFPVRSSSPTKKTKVMLFVMLLRKWIRMVTQKL